MKLPESVCINEVVLRDGLQLENQVVGVESKKKLFDHLLEANVKSFEFGSFVHPKLVPQMANSGELYTAISGQNKHIDLIGLVPNLKGAEAANRVDVKKVNFVFSASDTHNQQNVRKRTEQSLEELKSLQHYCERNDMEVGVALATSFGCPFEGVIPAERIESIVDVISDLDIANITLADTTGMANPKQVYELLDRLVDQFPNQTFNLHFHNTRGMGLSNIMGGLQAGVRRFDTALGGLGGCPFAPGATGNVCTEDVVHMLHEMGIETNIDLDQLISASELLSEILNHDTPSYIRKAGKSTRKYPVPNQI
ncbi:hydroxymethylglutaryl-CoA lyase [Halobacillus sp. Marseille-P3879]|uniref:hydroxymethylglutaryl-CoA lyase n=1 Tax=Halobacillus sp. Marseille-P3879 TaxID=2045014 RepID=UPI000C7B21B7|nr:hydroxymethylglutaryl-CoA lyase [Halobacillus sp. Marseille-P3879]